MSNGRNDQDDEVIRLLGRLKDAGPEYPSGMLSQRKAAVMAAFAALNLGVATAGLGLIAQIAKLLKGMGVVEKIILGAEVAAVTGMTTYGAIQAYVYRDQLKELLFPTSLSSETPFPSLSFPTLVPPSETGAVSETPTETPTPTGTLTLTVEPFTPTGAQPKDTPAPPAATQPPPASTNPGHHYGNTKTPQPQASQKTP